MRPKKYAALFFVLSFALVACNQTATELTLSQIDEPATPQPTSSTPTQISEGWDLTVYYTAVESYHSGATTSVSGCLNLGCSSRGSIGTYPSSFVNAVKEEGTGRITSGANAGKYLNWSYDVGYWLDTKPRDAYGNALVKYVSAASDTDVLPRGTFFTIEDCGRGIDASFCAEVQAATWKVVDQFTPGLGGARHIDIYIGEEDRTNFKSSPKYITFNDATLAL